MRHKGGSSNSTTMEVILAGAVAGVVLVSAVGMVAVVGGPALANSVKTAYRNHKRKKKEKRLFRQLNAQVRQSARYKTMNVEVAQ